MVKPIPRLFFVDILLVVVVAITLDLIFFLHQPFHRNIVKLVIPVVYQLVLAFDVPV